MHMAGPDSAKRHKAATISPPRSEHIYAKLGVSSRAAATLYATQHGLMGAFESAS